MIVTNIRGVKCVAEIRPLSEPPFFITNKSDGQHRHAISHARQW
jgi:hypothetical protein